MRNWKTLQAVSEAIKAHKGNEGLLISATNVLKRTAENKSMVSAVISSGSLQACLASLSDSDDLMQQGAVETTELLEVIATEAPESIINTGIIASTFELMESYKSDSGLMASCVSTLERVCRKAEGMAEIVNSNGIYTVISALNFDDSIGEEKGNSGDGDDQNEQLAASFSLLKRYTSTNGEQAIKYVRDCGGVTTLVKALESMQVDSPENLKLSGARLLTDIAGNDLQATLDELKRSSLDESSTAASMSLISNLALEADNIDTIVQSGGISTIVDAMQLETATEATLKATALALGRIADVNETHVGTIESLGGVEAMLSSLAKANAQTGHMSSDTTSAILTGLASVTSNPTQAVNITKKGGLGTVISTMQSHTSNATVVRAGIRLLRAVRDNHPEKLQSLEKHDTEAATKAIVSSLSSYNDRGSRGSSLGDYVDSVDATPQLEVDALNMLGELCTATDEGFAEVLDIGGIKIALDALQRQSSPESVKSGVSLLQAIMSDKSSGAIEILKAGGEACGSVDVVSVLLDSVNRYYDEPGIRNAAVQVLTPLVTPANVSESLQTFSKTAPNISTAAADEPLPDGADLEKSIMSLSVFATIPNLRKEIVSNGGVENIVKLLKSSARSACDAPELENILAASLRTISSCCSIDSADSTLSLDEGSKAEYIDVGHIARKKLLEAKVSNIWYLEVVMISYKVPADLTFNYVIHLNPISQN